MKWRSSVNANVKKILKWVKSSVYIVKLHFKKTPQLLLSKTCVLFYFINLFVIYV